MIGFITGLWGWISSKALSISIGVAVAGAIIWQIFTAGMNKQRLRELDAKKKDEKKRNEIAIDIRDAGGDAARERLRDKWSTGS